ncbi:hypothetical protein B4U80_00513 [Leptotrombidium deliense]|uniref:Sterol regulatory element-binding protein cleavage-activating protein n=1 Tax=Leptotrombidium deliense TaxID=299467 RepID=A0A443SUL5_9ACAR|nr:hypothetical protein B4U80_00513 [Leptotrombidium deliense]
MESSNESASNGLTLKTSAFLLSKFREKVSQIYYKHGLLCSTHPFLVLLCSLLVVSVCCYPILGLHILHNNHHQQYVTSLRDLSAGNRNLYTSSSTVNSDSKQEPNSDSLKTSPRWFQNSPPFAFVQQIIIKAAVVPWKSNLILMDAIRAPLGEVFPLVEFLSNHHLDFGESHSISLNDICFQVSEPVLINDNVASSYLPHYSCLVVSPANIWKNDLNKYLQDPTIINTLFSIKHLASPDSGNLREILFGVPWMETGIRRLYVRTRQRTVSFAITIVFSKYIPEYIDNLKQSLRERYPLDPFKDQFSMSDYFPLMAAYIMLFLYVYFSVRKIDLIKWKWSLACCSVITVMLSLLMTFGICLWFDFNTWLNGSDILPYLVVVIGPSFTKNLVLELTLLVFGFFTFVPVIQEFCLFGMVGLLSDFFLQLTFFATVLSADIQRIEVNKERSLKTVANNNSPTKSTPTTVFARPSQPIHFKLPKRLRFVYFWARTRIVHRLLMICLVCWIGLLVFRSGVVDQLNPTESQTFDIPPNVNEENNTYSFAARSKLEKENSIQDKEVPVVSDTSVKRLLHRSTQPWNLLSTQQWSTLFGYYNISLSGRYVSILPAIHLSLPVDPSSAMHLRHPSESDPQIFRQFLSPSNIHSLLDPNDDVDDLVYSAKSDTYRRQWTSNEVFFSITLSIPTLIFIIYVFVTLYRCMCSRNYAEWRSSWSETLKMKSGTRTEVDTIITETIPVMLPGHEQEIEFIATSEVTPFVVSCCMQGDVRVWDVLSGECHTFLKRVPSLINKKNTERSSFKPHHKQSGSFSSDSTYGSSPGNGCFDHHYDSVSGKGDMNSPSIKSIDSPFHFSTQVESGYDFSPFAQPISKSIIKDLILNAATNTVTDVQSEMCANVNKESTLNYQSVWCIDICDKLIFLGCKNGQFEVWDALNGEPLFNSEPTNSGVTVIRANSSKVIVGHLNGVFEIYELQNINGFNSHNIYSSLEFVPESSQKMYSLVQSVRAHSQPITTLQLETSHIITGSTDHLLKVYRIDNGACLYTLHGHCGGITVVEVDKVASFVVFRSSIPSSALSGCQVGQVCVWDLMTGTCVFSLEAHQSAAVLSLLATPLYFISSGTDNKLRIWDKYSGHLVHTITQHHSLCSDMLLLTPNILVTAKEDHLVLWDISEASAIRIVNLHNLGDNKSYIKNLRISSRSNAVVCEYGKLLCFIHFPGITQKSD